MDVSAKFKLDWNGPEVMQRLHAHLKQATRLATYDYYITLKKLLDRWGSVQELVAGFGTRRRVVHSKSGEPPRRQTGNLYESIRWKVSGPTGRIEGVIFTDVPYAPEIEYGGIARNYGQISKKYTKERLINPLPRGAYNIAPRPAWRIAFHKSAFRMLGYFTQVQAGTVTSVTVNP